MEEAFYTVEQVANLLQMHPKTIQRYIREGKLSAVKFGKGWRVSGHDLSVFTESATFTEARIAAALENGDAPRATASAVVDVTVSGREEAIRIMNALTAALNAKPRGAGESSLQTQYIEPERKVRVTIWGALPVVSFLLAAVETLTARPTENEIE